jgi:hypothetical protein
MFCVAYVQCKHHVSHAQEGIAALIIGTALGTGLFLIGEKSPKSEHALQNPLKEKKGIFFKSPYIITFAKLDCHLAMETLM